MPTSEIIPQKICTVCKQPRAQRDYAQNNQKKDGLNPQCKFCVRARWRRNHPISPAKLVDIIPGEVWRPVFGFETEYSVSNLGRVRGDRAEKRTFANRSLKPHLGKLGYYTVGLHHQTTMIHRLVAEAFLEPEKRHLTVNHKNGIRTDNRVENLEFVSHSENMAHAAGVLKKCGTRKLNDESVRRIRARFALGNVTRTSLAREHGVAVGTISKVVDRVWWKHVQ